MDKKSKILFFLILALIILTISATYYRFFIAKDYATYWDDYTEVDEGTEDI